MAKPRLLALERLEDRSTPSTSGVTWADGEHLTLSFVPDGTRVAGSQSSLFRTLNAVAPTATWQREIVRAFQTWAANTNLNVGVVADGGQALGTGGQVQGDSRFGDIRVAAVPMAPGTLITNTPFQWSGTTWAGDLVINTSYLFGIGGGAGRYDLYTAMLNEAANVLGVLDSRTDPSSAVYYQYVGPKTGLTNGDVADIKALYGARSPDGYDAVRPNGTIASATNLGTPLSGVNLEADVTTTTDVDYYKLTVPVLTPAVVGLAVKVTTSGLSTLTPTLRVFDAANRLVGSAAATDPLNGTLTVQVGGGLGSVLTQLLGGSSYTIRVTGNAGTGFEVGRYKLEVSYNLANGTVLSAVGSGGLLLNAENGANDVLTSALTLPTNLGPTPDARFDYTYKASISSARDVDYYKVQAPAVTSGVQKMNVLVWGLELNRLRPKVEVFDAAGRAVAAQLLANENGTFSVEVANTTPGAAYYVKISALNPGDGHDVGNYFLGVDLNTQAPTALRTFGGNTLTQTAPLDVRAITVTTNRLYEFILAANVGTPGAGANVLLQLVDAGGTVVFSLTATAGQPASTGHVYLKAGNYTVRLTASAATGSALPPCAYVLTGRLISDPIGPRTEPDSGGSSKPTTSWDGSSGKSDSTDTCWDQPYYW